MLTDTDAGSRNVQIAIIRRRSPAERMNLVVEMSELVRTVATDGELRRHPELTRVEARDAVLQRAWGRDLSTKIAAAKRTR